VPDAKFCGVIDYTVEFAWVPRASPPVILPSSDGFAELWRQ
jgi:hypothetical protein